MKGALAAILQWLVLPWGATTGRRIVLDGIQGEIAVYGADNDVDILISSLQEAIQLYLGTDLSISLDATDGTIRLYNTSGEAIRLDAPDGSIKVFDGSNLMVEIGQFVDPYNDPGIASYLPPSGGGSQFMSISGGNLWAGSTLTPEVLGQLFFGNAGTLAAPADPVQTILSTGYYGDTDYSPCDLRMESGRADVVGGRPKAYIEAGDNIAPFDKADLHVSGVLTAGNFQTGVTNIVPVPNSPTSKNVTYPTITAPNLRAFATAETTVPGSSVHEVSVSSVGASSMNVNIYRINSTATNVFWQIWGE